MVLVGLVHVTNARGDVSKFNTDSTWVEGPMTHADPNLVNWIGGKQLPGGNVVPLTPPPKVPEGQNLRQVAAAPVRESLRNVLGDLMDNVSDAELLDSIYLTVFPNFHPWGSFSQIVYRFRPNGDDHETCIMEVLWLAPYSGEKPEPAPIHWLDFDEPWTNISAFGMLSKVFDQDMFNMEQIQKGLQATRKPGISLSLYQESKVRWLHELLGEWVEGK